MALSKKMSQCQGCLAGQCQSPFAKKGGKKAGSGTDESRRTERDALVDNGQTTSLQGQKGAGPSQTQIEDADEGSGTSGARGVAKERVFKKQFESLVNREDVPQEVKSGVKNYFEAVHQMGQSAEEKAEEKAMPEPTK
jgi:hypothetical protein